MVRTDRTPPGPANRNPTAAQGRMPTRAVFDGRDQDCEPDPGGELLPDLVPKLIVAPVSGSSTVTLRVENQGTLDAPPGYVIRVGNLGAGQTIADTPALPAGGSTEFFIGLASTLPLKICARVDVTDRVIEADEGNNRVCVLNASLVN